MGLVGTARKGGGVVNVLDQRTAQWIAQVRVEGKGGVADFEWWADGEGLTLLGKSGEAVEWSLAERRVLYRWIDDGAVGTTVVALGGKVTSSVLGGDRWIAVGSQSGIVNVYDRAEWIKAGGPSERPVPTKSLKQLTTPTSYLLFSLDGQLLVMASRWKKDALKLSGWPFPSIPCHLSLNLSNHTSSTPTIPDCLQEFPYRNHSFRTHFCCGNRSELKDTRCGE